MDNVLPDKADIEIANTLRALSHPARLAIMRVLSRQSRQCCGDVTLCLDLAQSTVSQHLRVLVDAGLIEFRAEGTRNCYMVRTDRVTALRAAVSEILGDICVPEAKPLLVEEMSPLE
ncbi:MAG: winged helix-turn-helix transcriptional regulator [Alphaproteobacteria bacterium]|nr:winged helix-turn-helix transcriptional regulator [Alphaproteobacteria bacterium]